MAGLGEERSCCRIAEAADRSSWAAAVRTVAGRTAPGYRLVVAAVVRRSSSPRIRLVAPLRRWNWIFSRVGVGMKANRGGVARQERLNRTLEV